MVDSDSRVSLGFTEGKFPAGTHMCQIFGDDAEREETILKYLLSGIQGGERFACFSDKTRAHEMSAFLAENGISFEDARKAKQISLTGTGEIYFPDGKFDPDRMLNLLATHYESSVADGYPADRIIGEINSDICDLPGGKRLCEYECRINILLRDHPVTVVCQYDVSAFDGSTIMDVLKVHPMMVVRGAVVRNPFFMKPEEFLSGIN